MAAIIFKLMRFGKSKTSKGSDKGSGQEDTCESIPRVAPSKVQQTTVKHNYEGLTSLPVVAHCDSVRHLYLSHNRIVSLNGLQHYPNLTSLNASYNCLTKIAELRLLKRPQLMDKLSLRMNSLEFGYQDYAVEVLPNLRRLEGAELGEKAIRRQMARMKKGVEKGLVEFYRRTQLILSLLDREHDKQNKDCNGKNQVQGIRLEQRFWNKAKELYIWPSEEALRQKSIQWLISLCHEYLQLFNSADILTCHQKHNQKEWMEETRQAGQQLCSAILLKFSSRNDHKLKQYLQSLVEQGESTLDCFGKLAIFQKQTGKGAMTSTSIDTNPAKYMPRLNNAELLDHPMNRLANWKLPQCRTLIPFEETKWQGFYKSPSTRKEPPLLEQITVFLYAKEYLEVVTEIILEQVGKLLSLEHRIKQAESEGTEIELKLSSSAMSFGHKDQHEFDDSLDHHTIQQDIQSITLPYPQASAKKPEAQQEFGLNVQKYSIYQINLIFKALRSLKAAVKRKS